MSKKYYYYFYSAMCGDDIITGTAAGDHVIDNDDIFKLVSQYLESKYREGHPDNKSDFYITAISKLS